MRACTNVKFCVVLLFSPMTLFSTLRSNNTIWDCNNSGVKLNIPGAVFAKDACRYFACALVQKEQADKLLFLSFFSVTKPF